MNVKHLVQFGNFLLQRIGVEHEVNGATINKKVSDADLAAWEHMWGEPLNKVDERIKPNFNYGDSVNISFGSILQIKGAKVIKTHLTDKHIGYDLEFVVPVTNGPNGSTVGESTERLYNISQEYLSKD